MRCVMSKSRRFSGCLVLCSALALGVPPSDALANQGRGRGAAKQAEKARGEHKANTTVVHKGDHRADTVVIDRDGHVRGIRDYARNGSLPPGLAKRQSLPPGLRKQLRERGTLPPGLQRYLVPVPTVLVSRLPVVPVYYHRYFAGDDLIIVDTQTNRLVAILRDV